MEVAQMENGPIGGRLAVLQVDKRQNILSLVSNVSDRWMTTSIPFSSNQMIRNSSIKIGEVDSGSARLLISYHLVSGNHSFRSRLGLS